VTIVSSREGEAIAVGATSGSDVVGRETEVHVLRDLLDRLQDGFASVVLMGEAGIGKTALLSAAVGFARERDYGVLSCRPAEAEAGLSFAALADLLVDAIDQDVRDNLPEPQRQALDVVVLLRTPAKKPIDQRTIAAAVLSTLRLLAQRMPLVLAIDDLHWLDAATASTLGFVLRRVADRDNIGVLATMRSAELSQGPQDVLRELIARSADHLSVEPLGASAIARIIRQRLGSELPINVLRKIQDVSGGNPFFAVELARSIAEEAPREEHGAQLAVPADLRQVLRGRFSTLSGSARRALLFASAFAHPTVDSISALEAGARGGVAESAIAGIVGVEGDSVRFTHPLFASVIYGDATTEDRCDVHATLAEIARDPEERARHLALATIDPDSAVARIVEEGARYARTRGATASSAELFELAADLTPPTQPVDAARRRMDHAENLFLSGEEHRAFELMAPIVQGIRPGPERAEALLRLARIACFFDLTETVCVLREALAQVGVDDLVRSRIRSQLASALDDIGLLQEAERSAAEALALAESAGDPSTLAEALVMRAWTRLAAGDRPQFELLEGAVALEDDIETFTVTDLPSFPLAITLSNADELERSRPVFERLLSLSSERGDEHSAGNMHVCLSRVEFWAGNLGAANEHISEPSSQLVREWAGAGAMTALVRGCGGDVVGARERARDALAAAEEDGRIWDILDCREALGFVDVSAGDHDAAVGSLEPAWALHQQTGIGALFFRFPADLAESLAAIGRADEAEPIISWLAERGETLGRGWGIGAAARCRGLMLAARGDVAAAAEELEHAVSAHRPIGIPLELGRTLLTRGRVARRAMRKRDARLALDEAVRIFDGLPAPLWAAKAREELSRVGGRRPAGGRLTPTEGRVARLAAGGRTNQEIADALFLSVRTVESHLSHTYAKLGVRSRTELAGALHEAAIPP
jgi:DNA-binding CsgD family transcriptional regulator